MLFGGEGFAGFDGCLRALCKVDGGVLRHFEGREMVWFPSFFSDEMRSWVTRCLFVAEVD